MLIVDFTVTWGWIKYLRNLNGVQSSDTGNSCWDRTIYTSGFTFVLPFVCSIVYLWVLGVICLPKHIRNSARICWGQWAQFPFIFGDSNMLPGYWLNVGSATYIFVRVRTSLFTNHLVGYNTPHYYRKCHLQWFKTDINCGF
jgi:hypothetical protein